MGKGAQHDAEHDVVTRWLPKAFAVLMLLCIFLSVTLIIRPDLTIQGGEKGWLSISYGAFFLGLSTLACAAIQEIECLIQAVWHGIKCRNRALRRRYMKRDLNRIVATTIVFGVLVTGSFMIWGSSVEMLEHRRSTGMLMGGSTLFLAGCILWRIAYRLKIM